MGVGILGSFLVTIIPVAYLWDVRWWPVLSLPGIFWGAFIGVAHRSMPWEAFRRLSPEERARRALYDSLWLRLFQAGFGIYVSLILVLGLVLLVRRMMPGHPVLEWGVVGTYGLVMGLLWWQRWSWIRVLVEGSKARPFLWNIGSFMVGISLSLLGLGYGISRWMEALLGKEEARSITSCALLIVGWLMAIGFGWMSLLGLMIALAQYRAWRDKVK